jgi:hypothetical protein
MAEKTIKTRIQLKNDTEANWKKSVLETEGGTKTSGTSFVPLLGELIVFSADEAHPFSRLKVGDGTTNVVRLPFIGALNINGQSIEVATTNEWNARINYIPKKGNILIYSDKAILNDNTTVAGIKIGDGLAYGIDLPFVGDDIAENLMGHINNTTIHITAAERIKWNGKLNCNDEITNETLVFTRN